MKSDGLKPMPIVERLRQPGLPSDFAAMIEAANTIEQLLKACKRAKKFLEPEVTKEPDRTIFWELVHAIDKAESK